MVLLLEKYMTVLEKKNLDNKEIVDLCQNYYDLVTVFLLKISYVNFSKLAELVKVRTTLSEIP